MTDETLIAILTLIESDPHQWSTRPCATCRAITVLARKDFGCIALAEKKRKQLVGVVSESRHLQQILAAVLQGSEKNLSTIEAVRAAHAKINELLHLAPASLDKCTECHLKEGVYCLIYDTPITTAARFCDVDINAPLTTADSRLVGERRRKQQQTEKAET